MLNSYWNVYNRDGEEFKIHVKKDTIPSPSYIQGEVLCMIKNIICLARPGMCCPNCITIDKKSKNYLVIKENGSAREIWMRDVDKEKQIFTGTLKFVDLVMEK